MVYFYFILDFVDWGKIKILLKCYLSVVGNEVVINDINYLYIDIE